MTNKLKWKRSAIILMAFAGTVSCAKGQGVDTSQLVEQGKFRLHKFEQAIGWESYQITKDGDGLSVKADFKFNDRGTDVPLTASFKARSDWTPKQFEIKGKNSRLSAIDR